MRKNYNKSSLSPILDNAKEITNISEKDLVFKGGFTMNLKVMSGSLREKSDEVVFINALSKEIVESIKNIELKKSSNSPHLSN